MSRPLARSDMCGILKAYDGSPRRGSERDAQEYRRAACLLRSHMSFERNASSSPKMTVVDPKNGATTPLKLWILPLSGDRKVSHIIRAAVAR